MVGKTLTGNGRVELAWRVEFGDRKTQFYQKILEYLGQALVPLLLAPSML
jgi:hypothetical protein